MKKRLLCLLMAAVMVLCLLPQAPQANAAAKGKQTTRAIAIVFDNSGSMYGSSNSSWCRATYAMEVFASMMNEGDQLQIYPMWTIVLDKNERVPVNPPLVINGPGDADVIRKIFSPVTYGTPFGTVENAYQGLLNTQADEKYLIILTDGKFDDPMKSAKRVSEKLDEYKEFMNIMFLAIGDDIAFPTVSDPTRQYYDWAQKSTETLPKLTAMSNRIFGRNELTVSNNQITFDVSMGKIIVFVQGENVTDVKLSGGTLVSSHDMKYSEQGCGNSGFAIDRTLQGVIATYENLDAGTYTISYNGNASNINVYYEPAVSLQVQLIDNEGKAVDPKGKVYAGDYKLQYVLVDADGKPTQSKLLGDVHYQINYTLNGKTDTHNDDTSGSIPLTLREGDTLSGVFTVQFLENYTDTTSSDHPSIGWPEDGLKILEYRMDLMAAEVTGGMEVYALSELETQAVYQVKVTSAGKPFNDGELVVEIENGNVVPEVVKTDSGYTVTLRYPGKPGDTVLGQQQAKFYVRYEGDESAVLHTADFAIEDDSHGLVVAAELEQDYYVIPDIDDAAPIFFRVTCDGAPLSPEAFNKTEVQIEADVGYELEADPANSRYVVKLTQEGTEPGFYEIRCVVTGEDSAGRPCTVETEAPIECQNYPLWLRILVISLIIVLIAALIWAYLNTKVLPKKIGAGTANFVVNGKVVPGKIDVKYTGGGKKKGTLVISSPRYAADPAMKCGMRLELVADSPRRVRSSQRRVRVVAAVPNSKTNTTKMQIGGTTLVKNPAGQFVRMGTQDTKIDCSMGNNTRLGVTALILSPVKGKKVTVSLNNLPLKFY